MLIKMELDLNEAIISGFLEGFSMVAIIILPILLWMLIPAVVLSLILKNKYAWRIGILSGLIGYFMIGSNYSGSFF